MLQPNFGTISQLRSNTDFILKKASKAPLWLLRKSKPEGVILSVEKFQELIEIAEDYYLADKAKQYESENKVKTKWLSHDQVKKRYGL